MVFSQQSIFFLRTARTRPLNHATQMKQFELGTTLTPRHTRAFRHSWRHLSIKLANIAVVRYPAYSWRSSTENYNLTLKWRLTSPQSPLGPLSVGRKEIWDTGMETIGSCSRSFAPPLRYPERSTTISYWSTWRSPASACVDSVNAKETGGASRFHNDQRRELVVLLLSARTAV